MNNTIFKSNEAILKHIAKSKELLIDEMKKYPNWDKHEPWIKKLEETDTTPYVNELMEDLQNPLSCCEGFEKAKIVHFEWSYNDPYAYAYGFEDFEPQREDRYGFIDFDYKNSLFSESYGFPVETFVGDFEFENRNTAYLDYLIVKLAEIAHTAFDKLFNSEPMPNKHDIVFELCQHDRSPMVAYVLKCK